MSRTTPATLALTRQAIKFRLHPYAYDPGAARIGLQAAEALGLDPARTFKTLMCLADDRPVCVVIPSDAEVAMKALAQAAGAKSAQMMKPDAAERLTGFKVGGISPFGQKKTVPTFVDETIDLWDTVFINAGARGLLLEISPADALRTLGAQPIDLTA